MLCLCCVGYKNFQYAMCTVCLLSITVFFLPFNFYKIYYFFLRFFLNFSLPLSLSFVYIFFDHSLISASIVILLTSVEWLDLFACPRRYGHRRCH